MKLLGIKCLKLVEHSVQKWMRREEAGLQRERSVYCAAALHDNLPNGMGWAGHSPQAHLFVPVEIVTNSI